MSAMEKKKLVYSLETPFSSVSWPQIGIDDQDTLLELLCSLLSPIGRHRSANVAPSKGKREKKRKRKQGATDEPRPLPPPPEVASHVDVGLRILTRNLQEASQANHPNPRPTGTTSPSSPAVHYSVIFVARSSQPSILNSHLPQMIAAASHAHPSREPTRLVGLSKACEARLSDSLGIPRVSCVGIKDGCPSSKTIVDYARQHVEPVVIPWLKEAPIADFRETKIRTVQTTIGVK